MKKLLILCILMSSQLFSQKKENYSSYTWKFNSSLNHTDNFYSDSQGQVLWTIGNFNLVSDYIKSELRKIAKKQNRTPLIYKQVFVASAEIEIYVSGDIPDGQHFGVYRYNSKANKLISQGGLKPGLNTIKIENIKNNSRVGIMVKSDHEINDFVKIKVNKITVYGGVPDKIRGVKSYKDPVEGYDLSVPRPDLISEKHCGVPAFFWKSENWDKIKATVNELGGLCNVVEHINVLNRMNQIGRPGEAPPEPPAPNEPSFDDNYVEAPLEPEEPVKPVIPIITRETVVDYILTNYAKFAYINLENALERNSAYLVDTSGSVEGAPLQTIKAELKILADVLDANHYVSIYPMAYSLNSSSPYIDNFKKRNADDLGTELISAIDTIRADDDWDNFYPALIFALENKKIDTINILSDTDYNDYWSSDRKNSIKKLISSRGTPITFNVYNFGNGTTNSFSEELIKMGEGNGEIIENKKLKPEMAKKSLERILKTRTEEGLEEVIQEVLKEVKEEHDKLMEEYLQKLTQWEEDHAAWEEELDAWEEGQALHLEAKQVYQDDMVIYEQDYLDWSEAHAKWEKSQSDWQTQYNEYQSQVTQLSQTLESPEKVISKLESLKKISTNNEEAEYFQNLIDQITN
ncbi:hypothetical protein N9N67_01985 [Bacteriovoracaceae bacterium]|nr:hypothetical protein [Bacteriovoracaceae bacterium]